MTGAGGQIGSWLVPELRSLYGNSRVIATDIRQLDPEMAESGLFELLDATDSEALGEVVQSHQVDLIYHLAAVLSATGCLLYTSPSPRDQRGSRMPSSA